MTERTKTIKTNFNRSWNLNSAEGLIEVMDILKNCAVPNWARYVESTDAFDDKLQFIKYDIVDDTCVVSIMEGFINRHKSVIIEVRRNKITFERLGNGQTIKTIMVPYNSCGSIVWKEVFSNAPRSKVNYGPTQIPLFIGQLVHELESLLRKSLRDKGLDDVFVGVEKSDANYGLCCLYTAMRRWRYRVGQMSNEERYKYLNHTAFIEQVIVRALNGLHDNAPVMERVFDALDQFTEDGADTLSELYARTKEDGLVHPICG